MPYHTCFGGPVVHGVESIVSIMLRGLGAAEGGFGRLALISTPPAALHHQDSAHEGDQAGGGRETRVGGVRRKNIQIAITTLLGGIFHPGLPSLAPSRARTRTHGHAHTQYFWLTEAAFR